MDRYKVTFDTWNKVALLYQEKFMDLDLYNDSYDRFCALLQKGVPHILELGCGPGNITRYLLSKMPACIIDATDVSRNMIVLAKINNPSAHCTVLDCRHADTITKKYDAVICGFCIPYLSKTDCSKLISDCRNLLHENGVLYISFVEGSYERSGYLSGSTGDQTYFYYHSIAQLEHELAANGFGISDILHIPYSKADGSTEMHTIILAKK